MNCRSEVQLVMECNIRARVVRSKWAPSATSTPTRRPLNTLSNIEIVGNSKHYDVFTGDTGKSTKMVENHDAESNQDKKSSKKTFRRNKNNILSSEGDDDDLEENYNQAKKNLIIKLGSSNNNSRNITRGISLSDESKGITFELIEHCGKKQGKVFNDCLSPKVLENYNSSKSSAFIGQEFVKTESYSPERSEDIKKLEDVDSSITSNKRKSCALSSKRVGVKKFRAVNNVSKKSNKNVIQSGHIENQKESNKNLSVTHEIFSDSKEKLLRDTIDLTVADDTELVGDSCTVNQPLLKSQKKNILRALKLRKNIKNIPQQESFNSSQSEEKYRERVQPKRIHKSPIEFWLPRSEDSPYSKALNKNADSLKKDMSDKQAIKPSNPKICHAFSVSNENQNNTMNGYMKDITDLNYLKYDSDNGKESVSVGLGWQFPRYKCGVIKLSAKGETSGRTKHENSHFGGVILQGNAVMTIQQTEMQLKGGQMFHIPPLTDWRAANVDEPECTIYYWCGRL